MKLNLLLKNHKETTKKYLGKIIYSLFFMVILQSLSCSLILSPIFKGKIPHDTTGNVITYALCAISAMIWLLFQFGFQAMLLRMVKREFVTFGFIFYGFKKIKNSISAVLVFVIMFGIVVVLSRMFFNFVFADLIKETNETIKAWENVNPNSFGNIQNQLKMLILPLLTFFVAAFFLVLLPFVFTFQFKLENPQKSIFWAMKQSLCNIFNNFNYFKLIIFALLASWKKILIAIIAFTLSLTTSLGVFSIILNFIYFLNLYTALIQIQLTVPTMYHELTRKHEVGEILQIEA